MRRAVAALGRVTAADLHAVLLVGGSSRVPLVGQLVAAGLGRPVAVDADPKLSVAQGSALAAEAASVGTAGDATIITPVVPVVPPPGRPPEPRRHPARARTEPVPEPDGDRKVVGPSRRLPVILGAVAALVAVAVGYLLLRPDDDGEDLDTSGGGTTTTWRPPTTTTTAVVVPETPFVDVTGVEVEDGLYKVFFTPENFETSGRHPRRPELPHPLLLERRPEGGVR